MKLIIIEGTDRTGKDTLVNRVIQDHRHVVKRHWGFPKVETNGEKTAYQKRSFREEFVFYDLLYVNTPSDMIMIWNRAHIGEFVYGTIYRDSQPETWVWDLEKEFFMDEIDEVYLVLLYADPEFVAQKDDGKSYSAKIEDKTREISAFLNAFENSGIKNKLKIKVNEGNSYIDRELIYTTVKQFING
jgi:hypothetical protein